MDDQMPPAGFGPAWDRGQYPVTPEDKHRPSRDQSYQSTISTLNMEDNSHPAVGRAQRRVVSPRGFRREGIFSGGTPPPPRGFVAVSPNITVPFGPGISIPPGSLMPGHAQQVTAVSSMAPVESAEPVQALKVTGEKKSTTSPKVSSGCSSHVLLPTANPFYPSSTRLVGASNNTHSTTSEDKEPHLPETHKSKVKTEVSQGSEKPTAGVSLPFSDNVPPFQPIFAHSTSSTTANPTMPTIRQPTHQETAAEMMARFLQEGRSEEAHDVTAGTRLTSTQHHTGVPQAPRPLIVHQRYPVPSQQSFPVTPFNVEQRHPAYANVQLRAVQGGVPSSVPAQPAFATGQQRAYPPIPFYPPGVAASSYTAPINAPRPAPPTFRGHEDYTRAGVESFIRAAQERDAARREAHQAVRARLHAMNQESEVLDAASRGQKMPETAQRGHGNQGMAELALEQRRAQRLRRERFEERERVLRGDPDPQDAAREANYQRLVEYLNYPNYSRRAPDPLFPRAHVVAENPENQRLVSMFETALNNLSLYIEGYTNFQGGPSSQTEQVSTGRASTGQQSSRPNTGRTTSEIPNWNDPSIRNNPHIRREFLNNATFVPYMGPSGQGHHPRVFRDDLGVPLIDTKTPPTSVPMSLRSSATPSQPGNTRLESIPEEQETQHQPAPGSTRSTVVTGVTFASVLAGTSRTTEPAPAPPSLSMALAQRPASEAMDPAQMNNPGQATLTEQLSRGSTSMMRTQTLNRPGSQNSNGTPTPRRRRYRSRR